MEVWVWGGGEFANKETEYNVKNITIPYIWDRVVIAISLASLKKANTRV